MSTVSMSKLRFTGLLCDKDSVMDELFVFSGAHIKPVEKLKGTKNFNFEQSKDYEKKFETIKKVVSVLTSITKTENKKIDCKVNDFLQLKNKEAELDELVLSINTILDEISSNCNQIIKCKMEQLELLPNEIKKLAHQSIIQNDSKLLSDAENTKKILNRIYKGIADSNETILSDYDKINFNLDSSNKLFLTLKLKEKDYNELLKELNLVNIELKTKKTQTGYIELSYLFKRSLEDVSDKVEEQMQELLEQIKNLELKNADLYSLLSNYFDKIDTLKMYLDYTYYNLEKLKAEKNMVQTENSFILECYVEKKKAQEVINNFQSKFECLVVSEEKINKNDEPPTKTKNGKISEQANFIVKMYSVPKYGEVDPTFSVFLFFMVFFGFIMADVGYGVILAVVGNILASKNKDKPGAYKLWKLIGTGGIFAIIWGLLFGSFFGFSHSNWAFLPQGVMPDPQTSPIALLLICLLMGILQIIYGYILKGVNYFKQGKILEGIFNGFAWSLFLIGVVLGVANYLINFFGVIVSDSFLNILKIVEQPGLIIMLVSLALGVVCAGIGTKGFTKLTKSFSALYGIINLFSDILSYARLFGLMLSGAVIAQQFNNIGVGLIGDGVVGCILGAIVVLIGHAFNVSMSALSAYIHDVRLQYVEYFGKFYTGEGIEFKPFGAEMNYIKFIN